MELPGCATPTRSWGCRRMPPPPRSRARSGGSPRSCIPTPTRPTRRRRRKFAELNAAYEILGDDDKRKAFDRGEIDAEGKPRFQGFAGCGGGRGRGRRAPAAPVRTATSRPSPGGRTASSAAAAAAARRLPRRRRHRRYSEGDVRRRRPAGRRAAVRAGGFRRRRRRAATSPAPSPSRCRRSLTGTSRRVQLPTGKEIDAKIPAGPCRRPDHPAEGAGPARPGRGRGRRADHGHDRRRIRCSSATAPTCGLNCRSRFTRRCSAARCACRRSTARWSSPSRRAPARAARFRVKGKGLPAKDGAGDLYATIRIVLPDGGDAELEELMKKWRDGKPYDPRRDMS